MLEIRYLSQTPVMKFGGWAGSDKMASLYYLKIFFCFLVNSNIFTLFFSDTGEIIRGVFPSNYVVNPEEMPS